MEEPTAATTTNTTDDENGTPITIKEEPGVDRVIEITSMEENRELVNETHRKETEEEGREVEEVTRRNESDEEERGNLVEPNSMVGKGSELDQPREEEEVIITEKEVKPPRESVDLTISPKRKLARRFSEAPPVTAGKKRTRRRVSFAPTASLRYVTKLPTTATRSDKDDDDEEEEEGHHPSHRGSSSPFIITKERRVTNTREDEGSHQGDSDPDPSFDFHRHDGTKLTTSIVLGEEQVKTTGSFGTDESPHSKLDLTMDDPHYGSLLPQYFLNSPVLTPDPTELHSQPIPRHSPSSPPHPSYHTAPLPTILPSTKLPPTVITTTPMNHSPHSTSTKGLPMTEISTILEPTEVFQDLTESTSSSPPTLPATLPFEETPLSPTPPLPPSSQEPPPTIPQEGTPPDHPIDTTVPFDVSSQTTITPWNFPVYEESYPSRPHPFDIIPTDPTITTTLFSTTRNHPTTSHNFLEGILKSGDSHPIIPTQVSHPTSPRMKDRGSEEEEVLRKVTGDASFQTGEILPIGNPSELHHHPSSDGHPSRSTTELEQKDRPSLSDSLPPSPSNLTRVSGSDHLNHVEGSQRWSLTSHGDPRHPPSDPAPSPPERHPTGTKSPRHETNSGPGAPTPLDNDDEEDEFGIIEDRSFSPNLNGTTGLNEEDALMIDSSLAHFPASPLYHSSTSPSLDGSPVVPALLDEDGETQPSPMELKEFNEPMESEGPVEPVEPREVQEVMEPTGPQKSTESQTPTPRQRCHTAHSSPVAPPPSTRPRLSLPCQLEAGVHPPRLLSQPSPRLRKAIQRILTPKSKSQSYRDLQASCPLDRLDVSEEFFAPTFDAPTREKDPHQSPPVPCPNQYPALEFLRVAGVTFLDSSPRPPPPSPPGEEFPRPADPITKLLSHFLWSPQVSLYRTACQRSESLITEVNTKIRQLESTINSAPSPAIFDYVNLSSSGRSKTEDKLLQLQAAYRHEARHRWFLRANAAEQTLQEKWRHHQDLITDDLFILEAKQRTFQTLLTEGVQQSTYLEQKLASMRSRLQETETDMNDKMMMLNHSIEEQSHAVAQLQSTLSSKQEERKKLEERLKELTKSAAYHSENVTSLKSKCSSLTPVTIDHVAVAKDHYELVQGLGLWRCDLKSSPPQLILAGTVALTLPTTYSALGKKEGGLDLTSLQWTPCPGVNPQDTLYLLVARYLTHLISHSPSLPLPSFCRHLTLIWSHSYHLHHHHLQQLQLNFTTRFQFPPLIPSTTTDPTTTTTSLPPPLLLQLQVEFHRPSSTSPLHFTVGWDLPFKFVTGEKKDDSGDDGLRWGLKLSTTSVDPNLRSHLTQLITAAIHHHCHQPDTKILPPPLTEICHTIQHQLSILPQ